MFLLVGSLMVSFGTVEAFRLSLSNIFNYVTEQVGRTIARSEEAAATTANTKLPEYLPKGFIRTENDIRGGKTRMKYERGGDSILFIQASIVNTTIDAFIGDAEVNDTINGCPAIVTTLGNGGTSITWYTEYEYFVLVSNLIKSEVIKIAESVNLD